MVYGPSEAWIQIVRALYDELILLHVIVFATMGTEP